MKSLTPTRLAITCSLFLATLLLVLMTAPASALVITDNFDAYSDGPLTGQGDWVAFNSNYVSLDIESFTGRGKVANSTASSASNSLGNRLPFAAVSTGTVEVGGVSLQLNHPDSTVGAGFGAAYPYAISIINDRNAQFGDTVRWLITTGNGSGQYNELIGTESELLGVWIDTTLSLDLDANTATVTIEAPDLTTTTSAGWDGSLKTQVRNIDPTAVIDSFSLSSYITENGNRFNMVPEPSTMVLLAGGLASLVFVARRRKR